MFMSLCMTAVLPSARAQGRLSDKDVERTMRNARDDAKRFQSHFDSAVGKSIIRKTSQEKNAKKLVKTLTQQTEGMLKDFQRTKHAEKTIPTVMNTALQVREVMQSAQISGAAAGDWSRFRSEMNILAQAFNLPPI